MKMKAYMKGISPLLAAVLLIAFTVSLATVIFGFLQTTIRATTVTISNRTTEGIDCSTAKISIEDVYVIGTTSATVKVIVRNNGLADNLAVTGAVVLNSTGGNFSSTSIPLEGLDRGEIATLAFSSVSFSSCPSSFSKAIVATSCGGIGDTFDGTPKCK